MAVARGAGPLQRQVEDQLRAAIRDGRLLAARGGLALDGAARHGGAGATLRISFAAVPDAAAGHVAELIASAL